MQQCDKQQNDLTSQDVEIISKETVFKGFFKMVKYRFKHRLFAGGGSMTTFEHFSFDNPTPTTSK